MCKICRCRYLNRFEVGHETGSPWFQSAFWDCFGGRISTWRQIRPPKQFTMHFETISTRSPTQPQSGQQGLSFPVTYTITRGEFSQLSCQLGWPILNNKFNLFFLRFLIYSGYILLKLHSWFKSHVPLFLGMVMYRYDIETKNKIQNKDKIELQQIHLSYIAFTRRAALK